jgi:hypothetical protein
MDKITIVLGENVSLDAKMVDGKPVVFVETEGATISIPGSLVRKMDLEVRQSGNLRGCVCGYCGTSCSDNGTCYCGTCALDCWY